MKPKRKMFHQEEYELDNYLNDDDLAIRETLRVFRDGESFPKNTDKKQ